MDLSELKKLIISSLESNPDAGSASAKLEEGGISYDFTHGFTDRVLDKVYAVKVKAIRELEFTKYLNFAFSRIALTGVAAIVILLISILVMEGSLSLNSLLGINDSYDESIICLLTGN
jgi:hypothetical protein